MFAQSFDQIDQKKFFKHVAPESLKNSMDMLNTLFAGGRQVGDLIGVEKKGLETMYGIATAMYNNGQYEEALKLFRTLMTMNHLQKRYVFGLASTLQMLGKYSNAAQVYSYCFLMDKEDPNIPFNSAVCYIYMKKWTEAKSGLAYAEMLVESQKEKYGELATKIKVLKRNVEKNLASKESKSGNQVGEA